MTLASNRPLSHPATFFAGIGVLAVAWVVVLPLRAQAGFVVHMAAHMLVVGVAAPLLAIGVMGGRADPVRRWPQILPALPASLFEFIVVWAWHAPALHGLARGSAAVAAVEQASFLLAGFAVWIAAIGGAESERRGRAGAGIAALFMTSMHMTLLGVLLAVAPQPLYGAHGGHQAFDALLSQQWGGVVMLALGGLSYLAGGLWLVYRLLARSRPGAMAPEAATP